jgi:hypothetical protein
MNLLTKKELDKQFAAEDGWHHLVMNKAKPEFLSFRELVRIASVALGHEGIPVDFGYAYQTDTALTLVFREHKLPEYPLGYMQGRGAA